MKTLYSNSRCSFRQLSVLVFLVVCIALSLPVEQAYAAVNINSSIDSVVPLHRQTHRLTTNYLDTTYIDENGSVTSSSDGETVRERLERVTPGASDEYLKLCSVNNGATLAARGLGVWISRQSNSSVEPSYFERLFDDPGTPEDESDQIPLKLNAMGTQCLSNMTRNAHASNGGTPIVSDSNYSDDIEFTNYPNAYLQDKDTYNTWLHFPESDNEDLEAIAEEATEITSCSIGGPEFTPAGSSGSSFGLSFQGLPEEGNLKVNWLPANMSHDDNNSYYYAFQDTDGSSGNIYDQDEPDGEDFLLTGLSTISEAGCYRIQIDIPVYAVNEYRPTANGGIGGARYGCYKDGVEIPIESTDPDPGSPAPTTQDARENCSPAIIQLYSFFLADQIDNLKIQGQKVIGEGSGISIPGSTSPLGEALISLNTGSTSSSQPFEFSNLPYEQNYMLEVASVPGYEFVGYTLCRKEGGSILYGGGGGSGPFSEAEEPCDHSSLPLQSASGNTVVLEDADLGRPANQQQFYYVDLWFHFEEIEDKQLVFHKVDAETCNLLAGGDSASNDRVEFYDSFSSYNAGNEDEFSNSIEGSFSFRESTDYLRVYPNDVDWAYLGYSRHNCNPGSLTSSSSGLSVTNSDDLDEYHIYFHYQEVDIDPQVEKKVYGSVDVDISPDAVRDNRELDIDVSAYLWPDATHRFNSSSENSLNGFMKDYLWVAGVYGERVGDSVSQFGSSNENVNTTTEFNTVAEAGCPENCNNRVPLAYVPQHDGSLNPDSNPDGSDAAETPNGNQWLSIREESYGPNSTSNVATCSTHADSYRPQCGGRASNIDRVNGVNIGGRRGNHILNVEIGNIHIQADSLELSLEETGLQGYVGNNTLQVTDITGRNLSDPGYLPANSQGPDGTSQIWDNIRNPASPNNPLTVEDIDDNQTYSNTESGGSTFGARLIQPSSMAGVYRSRDTEVAAVQTVSLLQDGNGTYDDGSEPLSYTAMLDNAEDIDLVWDEYIDWTQVDDKGHWHTTQSDNPTGVDRREPITGTLTTYYISDYDNGSEEVEYRNYSCDDTTYEDDDPLNNDHNHNGWTSSSPPHSGSSRYNCSVTHTERTDDDVLRCTTSSQPTSWRYTYSTFTYYNYDIQTRYGWRNTKSQTQSMPYGRDGQSSQSAFYPEYSDQPNWSTSGVTGYWQDSNITPMTNSGSSLSQNKSDRWIYDRSDPAYSGRRMFTDRRNASIKTGTQRYGQECRTTYPNGSITVSSTTSGNNYTYYNPTLMYEDTSDPIDPHYGRWNSGVTSTNAVFDGNADGLVDTGWEWVSNHQRVRYEHTWEGHSRALGDRYSWRKGGRPGLTTGAAAERRLLYGLNPALSNTANPLAASNRSASILASRGTALIINPRIAAGNADVFAAGGLDSYFSGDGQSPGNSFVSSAFVFTQSGGVDNVDNQRHFNNYFINPDQDVAGKLEEGNLENLFRLNQLKGGAQNIASGTLSGNFPLNGNIYLREGNLTLNGTNFGIGAGTIIVEGDLIITNNTSYQNVASSNREDLPSVGFIVEGNVIIRDNVTNVVGAFAVNNCFIIDSRLANATNNCSNYNQSEDVTFNGDPAFRLDGLAIADRFALLRQPSGQTLQSSPYAEVFRYDGRVVVNNPPGFSRIFTEPQDWLEVTPRN